MGGIYFKDDYSKSYAELARKHNVRPALFFSRIYSDWTMEEALGLEVRVKPRSNRLERMKEERTLAKIESEESFRRKRLEEEEALRLDIELYNIERERNVIEKYVTPEEVVKRRKDVSYIEFRGRYYRSLSYLAKAYGIDRHQFNGRYLLRKWSIEQSLLLEPREKPTYLVEGVMYVGLIDIAEAYGFNHDTLRNRIKDLGWTLREALELVDRTKKIISCSRYKFSYGNKDYGSMLEACRELNICDRKVRYRVARYGSSVPEAIDYVLGK